MGHEDGAKAGQAGAADIDLDTYEPVSEDVSMRVSTESLSCFLPSCSYVFRRGFIETPDDQTRSPFRP